jgi:hypothetical protein
MSDQVPDTAAPFEQPRSGPPSGPALLVALGFEEPVVVKLLANTQDLTRLRHWIGGFRDPRVQELLDLAISLASDGGNE